MVYNSYDSLKDDIFSKVHSYIIIYGVMNNNINEDRIKHLLSMLRAFLYEIKIISEISSYKAEYDNDDIIIKLTYINEPHTIIINLKNIIRTQKLKKLHKNIDNYNLNSYICVNEKRNT